MNERFHARCCSAAQWDLFFVAPDLFPCCCATFQSVQTHLSFSFFFSYERYPSRFPEFPRVLVFAMASECTKLRCLICRLSAVC